MHTAKVTCTGVSPILMDPMTDAVLEGLRTGVRPNILRDRPAVDVAREKIYRQNGEKSSIGLPAEMLFASLVAAGRNVKNGKKQVSTVKTTTLPDFFSIQDYFLPFSNIKKKGKKDDSWKVDKRRGRLNDGTAICIVRPRFDKWEFEVTVEYDEKKADKSIIKALFANAGSAQGLGAFRPNCKGPFGRFRVTRWKDITKKN